jgi:L-aminopeptidase/D-esterase-like protein
VSGPHDAITDVTGVLVGHCQRIGDGWATGVTAVLLPPLTVGAVDVRGGAPGTRETDLLDPSALVQHVDAVLLCGGSAYGLAAADGAMRWLAARGRGFRAGAGVRDVVPIVPAAVLFDLRAGQFDRVPDASFGEAACAAAAAGPVEQGSVGAGAGAIAGRLKGGVGTASTVLNTRLNTAPNTGYTVGALVAVNPMGEVIDPSTGLPWVAGDFGLRPPDAAEIRAAGARIAGVRSAEPPADRLNTTIGVLATDAALTKAQCRRLATVAHDGLALAVRPAHSLFDGDTVFALATGDRQAAPEPAALDALCAAATGVFARAVVRGVLAATSVAGVLAYRDRYSSAVRPH